jgi:hypothetical protein
MSRAPSAGQHRAIVRSGAAVASTLATYEDLIPDHRSIRSRSTCSRRTREQVENIHAGCRERLQRAATPAPENDGVGTRVVAAGGLLGAGVDWGTGVLGLGDLRNYELLVQAGFAPERAIQIMTLNGARILEEEQRIGSSQQAKARI